MYGGTRTDAEENITRVDVRGEGKGGRTRISVNSHSEMYFLPPFEEI